MGGTWSTSGPEIVECPGANCRARYERRVTRLPMRDSDSKNCNECGAEIESWNSTRMPMFTRIEDTPEPEGQS